MKRLAILGVAIGLLAFVAMPAEASCGSLRQINSLATPGGDSYVYTPGFPYGGSGLNGSTVSDAISGSFWHVGNGDLTSVGLGNDNGSFGILDGWLVPYPNYSAYIKSDWTQPGIDGCIDNPVPGDPTGGARCMAIMLSDVDSEGNAVWALITSSADSGLNYWFGNGNPINLVPMPAASIVNQGGAGTDTRTLDLLVASEALAPGLMLDAGDDCTAAAGGGQAVNLIQGVQYYMAQVPQGSTPPDQMTGNWTPLGVGGLPDDTVQVTVPCGGTTDDIYIGYSIMFDGGGETFVVSGGSEATGLVVACDSTLAEPEGRIRIREEEQQPNRTNRRRGR
jgi:hypothetical protein